MHSLVALHCHWSNLMEAGASEAETLEETIESGPLCITDLFRNKSVVPQANSSAHNLNFQ